MSNGERDERSSDVLAAEPDYVTWVRLELMNPFFGVFVDETWTSLKFRILLDVEEGWSDSDYEEIGKMEALKFNRGVAEREGLSLFTAFDDFRMETAECYDVVFDKNGNIRKKFQDPYYGVDDYLLEDFHILFSIELDERYKGQGLVGHVTRIYLENFANSNDLVYLKAFPLQFDAARKGHPLARKFSGAFATCQSRLCKYYESLGFRRIGKTNHFFFVADHFLSGRGVME